MAETAASDVSQPAPSDPRLAALVEDLREALVTVAERNGVTNDELFAAISFLAELGGRNELHALSDVLRLSVPVDRISHADQEPFTPSNVEGPFWLPDSPVVDSPARLCADDEPGEHVVLRGRVTRADGAGVAGAIIDIWQTNAAGVYDVELHGSFSIADDQKRFRARVRTGANGAFEIHTVKPRAYSIPTDGPLGELLRRIGRLPHRPAHFHIKIETEGREPLTTMLYLADDPWLSVDVIDSVKDSLIVEPANGVIDYDFVLAG